MGLLAKITGGVKWLVAAPFVAINWSLNSLADASERVRAYVEDVTGIRKKAPREKIRAALREQWLDLAPGEKEIPGDEWEGEIYYETPK